MRTTLLFACLLGCFIACGPSPTVSYPNETGLALGTGTTLFARLDDGQTMELVRGPQGGLHFDVAVRIGVSEPDGAKLSYQIHDLASGARIDRSVTYAIKAGRLVRDGDGWLRLGDRVLLDTNEEAEVVGKMAELKAVLVLDQETFEDRCDISVVDHD